MKKASKELPVLAFESVGALRAWLMQNHATSDGIWLRIYKKNSGVASVSFKEVLDEGLCIGWSESIRHKGDEESYLQRFTPRQTKGIISKRNREHVKRLTKEKRMMPSGFKALEIEPTEG
ncbi:MAG: hypothetical protein ABIO92_00440 [Chloroflexia bacterium]